MTVLVLWLTTVTYIVFIRSLLSHRAEGPLIGMMVVTTVAVFEASLTILSISESRSPFVSCDTMDLMSSKNSSKAGSEYWMVLFLKSSG